MTEAVAIWHNPDRRASRNILAMIRAARVEPTLVERLTTPRGGDAP